MVRARRGRTVQEPVARARRPIVCQARCPPSRKDWAALRGPLRPVPAVAGFDLSENTMEIHSAKFKNVPSSNTPQRQTANPPTRPPSRLLVPLDQEKAQYSPCVVVVCLGAPSHEATALMADYAQQAEEKNWTYTAIELNDDLPATEHMLLAMPEDARWVVLAGHGAQSVPLSPAMKKRLGPGADKPLAVDGEEARHALDHLERSVGELLKACHKAAVAGLAKSNAAPERALWQTGAQPLEHPQTPAGRDKDRTRYLEAAPNGDEMVHTSNIGLSFLCSATQGCHGAIASDLSSRPQRRRGQVTAQASDVLDAFSSWLPLPDEVKNEHGLWKALSNSPDATHLVTLVKGLQIDKPDPHGPVAQLLIRLACAMAQDPAFAEQVLNLAHDSAQTCSDRKSLVLFRLDTALMAQTLKMAQRSGTAPQPSEVYGLANQVFKRAKVEAIASRKVAVLKQQRKAQAVRGETPITIDAVETYLAYVVELQDTAQLGGTHIEAKFVKEWLTHVTANDIGLAWEELQNAVEQAFGAYLCGYAPWQAALRADPRWGPEVAALEERLADYDSALQLRDEVVQEMAQTQVTGQALEQAITRELSRRNQEAMQQAWLALTKRVLDEEAHRWTFG